MLTVYSLPGSYYYNHNFVDYYNHNFGHILDFNRNFGRTVGFGRTIGFGRTVGFGRTANFGHITSFDHSFIIADPLDLLLAIFALHLAELQFEAPKPQN